MCCLLIVLIDSFLQNSVNRYLLHVTMPNVVSSESGARAKPMLKVLLKFSSSQIVLMMDKLKTKPFRFSSGKIFHE